MAKKNPEPSEPLISSIPVPPSDSALVIDLPDGQKLLVGKIEAGTVIEVATWRGTGRPDSRTNRLMLGMSNENDSRLSAENETPKPVKASDLKFPKNIQFLSLNLISRIIPATRVHLTKLISFLRKVDFKNISLRIPNLKSRDKYEKSQNIEISKSLDIEEEFDADFQRILDEVSQRRSSGSKREPRSTLKTPNKASKSESKSKKMKNPSKARRKN